MKLIAAPSINIVHNRVLIIVESLILVVVPRNLPLLPLQGAIEAGGRPIQTFCFDRKPPQHWPNRSQ